MSKRLLSALMLMVLALPGMLRAADYGLPANIQDGNILHCYNWKLSDITAELPQIAAAGFTSVQTSPLQRNVSVGTNWSDAYRPYDFKFIDSSGLGSRSDLQTLCQEAHKLGMKVIVDVVANHVDGHGAGDHSLYHDPWWNSNNRLRWNGSCNWGDRKSEIYNQLGGGDGYPDVNSEDNEVANRCKAYIEDLKSMGVDGIRWDAAKHIGLPSEGTNFWKIAAISGMYHYGEILDSPGGDNNMKEYTTYMSVTDNNYGNHASQGNGVAQGHAGWAAGTIAANKTVYWGESHDTYANDDGWSKHTPQDQIDRGYAIVACRNGEAALYLSRPSATNFGDIKIGIKGSTNFRTNKAIAAVNKFRNAMVGKKDYWSGGNGVNSVTRQGGGAVIVANGGNRQVSVANGGGYCPAGTYTDMVSGGTFTVTASTISGNVGSSGIAVIMVDGGDVPTPPVPTPGEDVTITGDYNLAYSGDKANVHYWGGSSPSSWPGVAMTTATGSDGKTYKVAKIDATSTGCLFNTNGNENKTGDLAYSGAYIMDDNGPTSTAVKFDGGDVPTPPVPTPGDTHYVYYDGTFSAPQVWAWNASGNCTTATAWPGDNMTKKDGKWYWEVPSGKSLPTEIIIHEGENKIGGGDLTYVDKATYHQDGSYTEGGDIPTPSKPVVSASPASGSFSESITVTLSSNPAGTIYYTTDGSTPNESSAKYTAALKFTDTTTLNAFAVAADGTKGDVKSFRYTKSSTPGPQPQPGSNLITDYYKVNPDGHYGTNKTINVTGHPATSAFSNWTEAELIAQGVARDVCQAFRGTHERPIVDSYAIYGAYDSQNLYLGVQMVYTVWDLGGEGKQPGESKPHNMDGHMIWAFDLDPNKSFDGYIAGAGPIWSDKFKGAKFENGVDHILMAGTKPQTNNFTFFKPTPDGHASYDPEYCIAKPEGLKYGYADGLLPSIEHIWGQSEFGYDPELLKGNTGFVDLRSEIDDDAHTFYEFKIPLSLLGITDDYIRTNGIGVMYVDKYGVSPVGGTPYDPSYFDNPFDEYSYGDNTSKEKEDEDIITYAPARIGAGAPLSTNTIKSDRDLTANFRLGEGFIEFYGLNGEAVSVSSIDGRNMFNSRNTSDVTVDLPAGIYIINIDGVGKAVRVR